MHTRSLVTNGMLPPSRPATLSARGIDALAVAVLVAGCLLVAGCQAPGDASLKPMWSSDTPRAKRGKSQVDAARVPTRDDIVKIVQFWPQTPWLFESDRIVGFKATIYFVSGQTDKGAFVPGTIFIWIYEYDRAPRGRHKRRLAWMWELDEHQAEGFRVTRKSIAGYYYGFPLRWPAEVKLEGKMVEFQFGYQRGDGRIVLSSPKRFVVPVPLGYEPEDDATPPASAASQPSAVPSRAPALPTRGGRRP